MYVAYIRKISMGLGPGGADEERGKLSIKAANRNMAPPTSNPRTITHNPSTRSVIHAAVRTGDLAWFRTGRHVGAVEGSTMMPLLLALDCPTNRVDQLQSAGCLYFRNHLEHSHKHAKQTSAAVFYFALWVDVLGADPGGGDFGDGGFCGAAVVVGGGDFCGEIGGVQI